MFNLRESVVTAVILTHGARVEGRVWAALHYIDPVDPRVCPKLVFRLRETLLLPLTAVSRRLAAPPLQRFDRDALPQHQGADALGAVELVGTEAE